MVANCTDVVGPCEDSVETYNSGEILEMNTDYAALPFILPLINFSRETSG